MNRVIELRKSLHCTIAEAGEDLLQKIQSLVNQEEEPIEITDPEFIAAIEEGLEDYKQGRVCTAEELIAKIETWGKRLEA